MNKIVKIIFAMTFVMIAGYSVYSSQKTNAISDLVLANVEALALSGETGGNCRTNTDYTSFCNYYDNGAICPCGF